MEATTTRTMILSAAQANAFRDLGADRTAACQLCGNQQIAGTVLQTSMDESICVGAMVDEAQQWMDSPQRESCAPH